MAMQLPGDFKEFLKLLNSHQVEYLLIGGYAVGYYGYVRATADLDIWVAVHQSNADRLVQVLREFGFSVPSLSPSMFMGANRIVRMGAPPMRIELLTSISGVEFEDCFARRVVADIDGLDVNLIDLHRLKSNKQAAGRHKDLDDLEHLP